MAYRMKQIKEGKLIKGRFKMGRSPVDVQITKHIANFVGTYGKDNITVFKELLNSPYLLKEPAIDGFFRTPQNLINHYGIKRMKKWFTLVYDWEWDEPTDIELIDTTLRLCKMK